MAWGLVYSFTNIPYASLASVMTRDVEERSQMATTRQAGSIGAQLITGIAFVPSVLLFDQPHHGFFVASIVMAVVGVLGFAICYFNCHEHVPVKEKYGEGTESEISRTTSKSYSPTSVIVHYLDDLIHDFRHEYEQQMMIFFCQYNLGHMGLQPVVNGIMMGCSVIGILLIRSW